MHPQTTIPYTVVRSRRKTLALTVQQDLTVVVRSPMRTSQKVIDQFVESNRDWIAQHIARQAARNEAAQTLTPSLEAELRQRAASELPGRVAYYGQLMGLTPASVRINGAKTRLGSCGPKNSLNFSFRLMAFPQPAIDYVVVHELAHIRHKNHGPRFYALIAQYLPDYKTRWAMLKDPQYQIR